LITARLIAWGLYDVLVDCCTKYRTMNKQSGLIIFAGCTSDAWKYHILPHISTVKRGLLYMPDGRSRWPTGTNH
jgi:hypothetical protein